MALSFSKTESFYIIAAEDDFYTRETAEEIRRALFKGADDPSAVQIFDYSEKETAASVDEAIEAVLTASMFSPVKLVILKEFYKLNKENLGKIFDVLKSIPAGTCLVMTTSGEITPARRDELKARGIGKGNLIEVSKNQAAELPGKWTAEYAAKNGVTIDADVAEYIITESNGDISSIKNEIDKLMLFAGDRKELTKEDFNSVRGVTKDYDIWALVGAVQNMDPAKTFRILDALYDDSSPEAILGTVFSSIKDLYIYIFYEMQGNAFRARAVLGGKVFFIEKEKRTRFFKKVRYEEVVSIFREADRKIKLSHRDLAKSVLTLMFEKLFTLLKEKNG